MEVKVTPWILLFAAFGVVGVLIYLVYRYLEEKDGRK